MGNLLYIVRDAYRLKGPGLVVVAESAYEDASLRLGDAVELRRPNSSAMVTEVQEFPLVNPYDTERQVLISFSHEVREEDVPNGTEVWSHP